MLPEQRPAEMLKSSAMVDTDCASLHIDSQRSTSSNLQKEISTFEPFPRLPIELRLKIWHLAITRLQERLLRVDILHHPGNTSVRIAVPTPSFMFVNHECRHEAEKLYRKVQPGTCEGLLSPQKFRTFYIDPDKDILIFGGFSECRNPSTKAQLQIYFEYPSCISKVLYEVGSIKLMDFHFTAAVKSWWLDTRCSRYQFKLMPNLKKLILVPAAQDSHCKSLGEQRACVRDIEAHFQRQNKKNPAYPMPVVEFESTPSLIVTVRRPMLYNRKRISEVFSQF